MGSPELTPLVAGLPALVPVRRAGGAGARSRAAISRPHRRQRKRVRPLAAKPSPPCGRRPTAAGCTATPRTTICAPRSPRIHGVDAGQRRRRRRHRRTARPRRASSPSTRRAVVTSDGAYPTFNFHVAGRRRAPGARALSQTTARISTALARCGASARTRAPLRLQSRQSDGNLVGGGRCHAAHRALAGRRAAAARRSLWRHRACRRRCRPSTSANRKVLRFRTLFESLRPCRRAHRLCLGEAGVIARLREDPQPLRHQPRRHRSARSPRSRIRNISPMPWHASRGRATASATIAAPTASSRCPRRPISSPSIAAATAPSPSAC